jgi:hypothetical protein
MGNCQVRFCRRGWRSDSPLDSNPTIKRRRGNLVVIKSTTNSTLKEVLETLKCARSLHRPSGRCR